MPPTRSISDCRQLANSVESLGGRVPEVLQHLLSTAELLMAPGATQAPIRPIVDAALRGELLLDEKKLDKLIAEAAQQSTIADYRKELRQVAEPTLVAEFHKELKSGAADLILDSMRPVFTEHAHAIGEARSLINAESSAEQILATGQPELVTAWQQLNTHLAVVSKIGAIAAQFGARPTAQFPQISEYPLAENARLTDAAIMCTAGPLVADSALFLRPDTGHRTSPWARTTLKLHTIEEARERYNAWAAIEFDRVNGGPRGGWIDEHGEMHEDPRPVNPYRAKVSAS